MEQSVQFSTFWFAIPQGVRIALLVLLLLLILRPILLFLVKHLIIVLTKTISLVLSVIFIVFEYFLGFLFRLFRKNIDGKWAPNYERFVQKLMINIKIFESNWKDLFTNKSLVRKRYKAISFLMLIIFVVCSFKWSTYPVIKAITDTETRIIHQKLGIPNLSQDEALGKITVWVDTWGEEVSGSNEEAANTVSQELTLKPEYDGGNIREGASKDAKVLTIISPGETVIYLGDDFIDNENQVWYKIQTKGNFVGWISGNIVE